VVHTYICTCKKRKMTYQKHTEWHFLSSTYCCCTDCISHRRYVGYEKYTHSWCQKQKPAAGTYQPDVSTRPPTIPENHAECEEGSSSPIGVRQRLARRLVTSSIVDANHDARSSSQNPSAASPAAAPRSITPPVITPPTLFTR